MWLCRVQLPIHTIPPSAPQQSARRQGRPHPTAITLTHTHQSPLRSPTELEGSDLIPSPHNQPITAPPLPKRARGVDFDSQAPQQRHSAPLRSPIEREGPYLTPTPHHTPLRSPRKQEGLYSTRAPSTTPAQPPPLSNRARGPIFDPRPYHNTIYHLNLAPSAPQSSARARIRPQPPHHLNPAPSAPQTSARCSISTPQHPQALHHSPS